MLAQFLVAPQTPAQVADLVVQCIGLGLLIIGGAVLLSTRRFGAFFRLPEQPAHELVPVNLMISLLAIFWIPAAVVYLFSKLGLIPPPPTSMPEDWMPGTMQLWVGGLSHVLGILILVAVASRSFVDGCRGWGLRGNRLPADLGAATVAYLAVWPLCASLLYVTGVVINLINPDIPLPKHSSIKLLQAPETTAMAAALTVIEAGVIAPIIEEMFFRGLVQSGLARWWRSTWTAIIFCGLAFGATHARNLETVPALALFGIVLGFVYARTRSLTAAIALHMLFNMKTLAWLWLDKAMME